MKKKRTISERVGRLVGLLQGKRSALIVLQDNPDPDAIGSAVGLKQLFSRVADMRTTIAHGGTVGRAENRALVEFLGVKLEAMGNVQPGSFDLVVMVDTQPATGNNSLIVDGGNLPDIVIDHHPRRPELKKVKFAHVDTRYGATSTMISEYLFDQDIKPNKKTATALVYGIKTDTAALTREASQADRDAMQWLYPLHLPEVLARIENEKVPRTYFQDFRRAMEQATIYGQLVFANLNRVQNPDMVGEIADFLARLEEMQCVLVVGAFEDELILSCRAYEGGETPSRDEPVADGTPRETSDDRAARELDAGAIMKVVVGELGAGGGHATMAGGRIPLQKRATKKDIEDIARQVENRFIGLFGLKRKEKKDLT